jgi:tRNA-Thr(GGU) m(6)t(6)A37 methyltransferase TsaA
MSDIIFHPIGYIETGFDGKSHIPRQGSFEKNTKGVAILNEDLADGLRSLDGFSHCWILFHFDRSQGYTLLQETPVNKNIRGVFSIRSPKRPNPVGMTAVKIEKIEKNRIYFSGADMINGTPIIDIKPYVEDIDCIKGAGKGWIKW